METDIGRIVHGEPDLISAIFVRFHGEEDVIMEMGIVRDLFKYAGYLVVFPVIQSKSFSDRVLIPEMLISE